MGKKQKYFFVFVSLFIYIVSVCGVTINKHFCGGELESVSLLKQDSCCGGEMDENDSDGCCANETIHISNNSESINSIIKIVVDPLLILQQTVITHFSFNQPERTFVTLAYSRGKPPSSLHSDLSYLMVLRI
ncbi:MAG: HYC_CC_PP family protein [Bacteroidia bacterium]